MKYKILMWKFIYLSMSVIVDKRKVLNHHPDKRRARGLAVKEGEDDYFTCITRGRFYASH